MKNTFKTLSISFFLNDKPITVTVPPEMNVLTLLREIMGLYGTKESCSEGDCGSCTIALGELQKGTLSYRAVNSCLLPAARLHGKHIITIEGLAEGEQLHPVQRILLENHATQCGYCTPGIIMSLFCLFSRRKSTSKEDVLQALEGNLCRCTGYQPILNAAEALAAQAIKTTMYINPPYVKDIKRKLASFSESIMSLIESSPAGRDSYSYVLPRTLTDLFKSMNEIGDPELYRIISGGTDLMVDVNVRRIFPKHIIDISEIDELHYIREEQTNVLIGAGTTFSDIIESDVIQKQVPILRETACYLGSQQIRNVATLAGNVANASPIADGTVTLLGLDAELKLISEKGTRTVKLKDFFQDYKQTELQAGEIIGEICISAVDGFYSFEKSSKRVAVDIASVNSCCSIFAKNGIISDCRFAFGGMDKIPRLADKCADIIIGKMPDAALIRNCADVAVDEFKPISDVRGRSEFRKEIVRNQVIRHLYKFSSSAGKS